MVEGDIGFPENVVFENERYLVFLDGYPRAYGYTVVAPKEHREQVTGDFTIEEYTELQQLIYKVTEAVRQEVGAERMYIFTFGANEGNSHVDWHVSCRCRLACPTRSSKATGPAGRAGC
jgi:ATP adenylyltransferase